MNYIVSLIIAFLVICSCGSTKEKFSEENDKLKQLKSIEVDTDKAQCVEKLGEPDITHHVDEMLHYVYVFENAVSFGDENNVSGFTLVFMNEKLVRKSYSYRYTQPPSPTP